MSINIAPVCWDYVQTNIMTTANSEYFIVYTLLAALMFWKGMVCQRSYTTVKQKQTALQHHKQNCFTPVCHSSASFYLFFKIKFLSPFVLVSLCVTQSIFLLCLHHFHETLSTNTGTSWGCQLAASFRTPQLICTYS